MQPGMNIGLAIVVMRYEGKKVARVGWNEEGTYLFYQLGYPDGVAINENTAKATGLLEGSVHRFDPYIMMHTADGSFVPWSASQTDLLADDYLVVGEGSLGGSAVQRAAELAHEANRAYCRVLGDMSQLPWDEAPQWQKDSACAGVLEVYCGRGPEDLHKSWMSSKIKDGWVYGSVKDPVAKTHPCLVPYEELPEAQRLKDYIFLGAVVSALNARKVVWTR